MKKKLEQNILFAMVAIAIISLVIFYSYTTDQAKIRGFSFGNNLQIIQDELKQLQTTFESKVTMWKEGDITTEEITEFSKQHFEKMENLILQYDDLSIPDAFVTSVKLFKLSTETQLQSDRELIKWIQNNDESAKIHSDSLFQEAFEYEMAALSSYNSAKGQNNP